MNVRWMAVLAIVAQVTSYLTVHMIVKGSFSWIKQDAIWLITIGLLLGLYYLPYPEKPTFHAVILFVLCAALLAYVLFDRAELTLGSK